MKKLIIVVVFLPQMLKSMGYYGSEMLTLPVGGRVGGMGGSYIGVAEHGEGVWVTPVSVVGEPIWWGIAGGSKVFGVVEIGVVGVGKRVGKIGVGVSFLGVKVDDIPILPQELVENPIGYCKYEGKAICLSGGYKLKETIKIGWNLKYLVQELYKIEGKGGGIDFGISYDTKIGKMGLVIKDIGGTKVCWETGEKDVREMNAGIGVGVKKWEKLLITGEIGYEYGVVYRVGGELNIRGKLFLRCGYSSAYKESFGVGVKLKGITVDYCVKFHKLGKIGILTVGVARL